MQYLTDRKRAVGKGAGGSGTEHHWSLKISSIALAILIPAFLYIFGRALGQDRATVLATFAHPFPAILTGLVLVIGMRHFAQGAQIMIEDYARGGTRKALIIGVTLFSYAVIATGLFALARIVL